MEQDVKSGVKKDRNHETDHPSFFTDGGEMGTLMRAFPWEKTKLGDPWAWPQSLKTAVRIILTSQQPMFVWWSDDFINLYNDPYRAILGGKHPAALGQPAAVVWNEIWDQVGPRAQVAIARNQGTYDEALFLMMERNGYPEETYYTFSYSPIPGDSGETSGIFCANTDETQRIITGRWLATQRELAAGASDALSTADACANSMRALNRNLHDFPFTLLYLKRQGTARAECVGRSGVNPELGKVPFEDPNLWPLDEVLHSAKGKVIKLPKGIEFPTGAWAQPPAKVALLPINPSGQSGYSGVLVAGLNPHREYDEHFKDFLTVIGGQIASALTNARAYEEERKRAQALEELDRAKTTFFANISHEFRTPLTLMLGPVEELLSHYQQFEKTPDRLALETVYRNATRLQKLVNALLDFSRIEAGRMSAQFQHIDLAAYTSELASAFESAMDRAGLRFVVDCVPLSASVAVDTDMWEKIVLNLLSNALKYTLSGEVALRLAEKEGSVELSVSDTGIGIPQAELPHLFERFHRVAGAQGRTYEGTGIGLALVHELVGLHGGAVSVKSELGKGSVFTVSLPLQSPPASLNPAAKDTRTHPNSLQANTYVEEALGWLPQNDTPAPFKQFTRQSESLNGRTDRILLVDDNADMRNYLQRLLSTEFEVDVFSNGRQALAAATANPPDLIISDIMMPELDGLGLLRELRANSLTRTIPFVFLSARAGEEESAEGREAGADDYIVKPFTARELLARVRGTLLIHKERRHAVEQLNQIFEQAPVSICVLSKPDFIYELANPYYGTLIRGRQIVGRKIADVLPDLHSDVWQAFDQVVNRGEPFVANEWYVPFDSNGDGQPEDHWFNVVYNPLRNSDQSIRGLVSVSHDVTKQVLSRKEVERVNRELEEFAYVASHDLQEPLRMVNAYSQLLVRRMGSVSPEQTRKYADFISAGVQRMEQLIRDLLSFARTVQSETVATQAVSLQSCLHKALDILQVQIEEKQATIDVGDLPVAMGDETQIPQLFQNLISNALKYSKTTVAPRIQVSAVRNGKEWIISVKDNGIGFKQEYANRIFGLFKRLHNDEYPGTGLGLAICRRIVERCNGRIWAESVPGEGSTFSFTLGAKQ
jgi:signal transduction histidine kinase